MTDTPTPAGLAGAGPWYAVLAWRDGYLVTDLDDLDDIDSPDVCRIEIVRGEALPRGDGDGSLRLPGSYAYGDLLLAFDGEYLDSRDELLERWRQVQAMVDGLNRAADRPSVAADDRTTPGEGDGQDTTPPDAQRAAEAVAAREAAVRAVLDTMGWADDRDDSGGEGVPPAPCWTLAGDIVNAVYPSIAADALRRYADRHHAHPGGPTNLIQTLTIREAGGAILDYDACRSCSARLDEFGQCTGERPRLLEAARRIAAGEPAPPDPPRPGTEWTPEPVVREADRG